MNKCYDKIITFESFLKIKNCNDDSILNFDMINDNKPPSLSKSKKSEIYLLAGAIAGIVAEYLANITANMLLDDQEWHKIRSGLPGYVAGMISGAITAYLALDTKVGLFPAVFFGTGIYVAVYDATATLTGEKNIDYDNFIQQFLINTFAVYGILWLQQVFIDEFKKTFKINEKEKTIEFSSIALETIISGVLVSIYFGYITYLREKGIIE